MYEINWMYLYLQAWVPIHGMEELCSFGCCTEQQHSFFGAWKAMWQDCDYVFRLHVRPDLQVGRD